MTALVLNRRRTSFSGILALVAAIGTGLAVYSYLSFIRAQIPIAGTLIPIVAAAADIEPGATLTSQMLELTDHPSRYLPTDAITSKKAALGRIAAVPVFKGEPITSRKIGDKGGASSIVPPGMRAYSLPVAAGENMSFVPKPGDHVDLIATFPSEVLGDSTSVTVLRGKQVASVGAPTGEPADSEKVTGQLGISAPSRQTLGLTLFVTPEEAQELAMAESLGKITIVLAPNRPDRAGPLGPVTAKDMGG